MQVIKPKTKAANGNIISIAKYKALPTDMFVLVDHTSGCEMSYTIGSCGRFDWDGGIYAVESVDAVWKAWLKSDMYFN